MSLYRKSSQDPRHGSTATLTPPAPMTNEEMLAVVKTMRPGDRFTITFADLPLAGDLENRLNKVLALCEPQGNAIRIGQRDIATLKAVRGFGRWNGFLRTYDLTVLSGFNADEFADLTVRRDLLESIERF